MKTFKEYGLPPSAAKGAKAHIKPLPKKEKVDMTKPLKAKPVTTKINLKGLKKVTKFYDKPLKQKGYPEQEASLPPHLQIFNKHGNVDPKKVSQKVHQGKKAPKFTVTDVTPKGYGPKNEAKVKGNIYYKVNIEGLPPLYLPGEEGVGKIKAGLRKLLKRPDMVTDMERQTGSQVRKAFRMMGQGKEDEVLKHVKEAVGPDSPDDKGEYDYEGEMAKNQLNTMIDAAKELHDMLGDDDNLPEWVQSKITKATDYIDSVRDYLKSESES